MVTRNTNSVQILMEYGLAKGLSREQLLTGTQINSLQLLDEQQVIAGEQELCLVNNLLSALGSPVKLGIELGQCYPLTSYGIFGYAMLSSPTFRHAIEFGIRYLDLTYVFSTARFVETDDNFTLNITTEVPGELGSVVLFRDMFAALSVLGELFASQKVPLTLNLNVSQQQAENVPELAIIEHTLEGGIRFSAGENSLQGQTDILDLPLPKAHAGTAKACELKCSELLQQKRQLSRVSAQIRELLVQNRLNLSMEEVACNLGKTSRTLHRKLNEEGTSWRALKDQVTVDLAEELLKQPLKVEQIAYRLGYSDAANFSNSFKRCTGKSPSEFRRSLNGTVESG